MKKILLIAVAAALFTGCRKIDNPTKPPTIEGTPTAKGTSVGTPVTKTIGSAGGSFTSADKVLTVTVPAGAVTTATNFSVEPITNFTPNGIGLNYRLLPEGLHFEKPVTITFHYTDSLIDGSRPQELHIASQNAAGIWEASENKTLDASAKTISVQSNHFSDWGLLSKLQLFVDKPSIGFVESATLEVREVLIEKIPEGTYLIQTFPSKPFTVDWMLTGDGEIDQLQTFRATYTSPNHAPQPNPVYIDAKVHAPEYGNPKLTRRVYVSDSYLEIVLDNNTNIYPNATAYVNGPRLHIEARNQANNGGWLFPAISGPGSFTWGVAPYAGNDLLLSVGGIPFGDLYTVCTPPVHTETTQGTITVTKWPANVGDFVEGHFQGEVVRVIGDRSCTVTKKYVTGRFRARRTQ